MDFQIALNDVLGKNPDETHAAITEEYAALCGTRPIVLFGAGPLGHTALAAMSKASLRPVAFADNNAKAWGQTIDGIEVLSPADAVEKYGSEAAFVVSVYNPSSAIAQLKEMGCNCVVSAAVLWRGHIDTMAAHGSFDTPDSIFAEADDVARAFDLMADDESREEFIAQLRWRTETGLVAMPPARSGNEIYFPTDLFALRDTDSYVDCGAFDGDTLRMVLAQRGDGFTHFTGFEPDPDNFARFQGFVASLPESQRSKIEGRNAATGARTETVRFHAIGTAGSGISGAGEIEMACVRLDEALTSPPTFIKMDIEGAEPDAIEGARETLARDRPVLAVCVYHATDHLWRIPLLLNEIQPGYKLYLRRYAEDCWELVVYAVPTEGSI
ncbi:MAG TPA: FkbM family methyltransferase [Abditibacteriaceae bacterium]|jgi:FkbM family methyltransferase